MKINLFFIITFFISSITFSQIKVDTEYIEDGIYKFSALGKYNDIKARNAISNTIEEFGANNNLIQDFIRQKSTNTEPGTFAPQYRYDVFIKFYRNKDSILFLSPEEYANYNAKIIETLKQYKKLKDDKVFEDSKYLELVEKLIDSLVVF
jgi:hypothetical protein